MTIVYNLPAVQTADSTLTWVDPNTDEVIFVVRGTPEHLNIVRRAIEERDRLRKELELYWRAKNVREPSH